MDSNFSGPPGEKEMLPRGSRALRDLDSRLKKWGWRILIKKRGP